MKPLSKKMSTIALVTLVVVAAILILVQVVLAPHIATKEPTVEPLGYPVVYRDAEERVDYGCTPERRKYNFPPIQDLPEGWRVYQSEYLGIQFAYPPQVTFTALEPGGSRFSMRAYEATSSCLVGESVSFKTDTWGGGLRISTIGITAGREAFEPTSSTTVTLADGETITVWTDGDCSKIPGWNADCGKQVSFTDKGVEVWGEFFVDTPDSPVVYTIPVEMIFKTFGVYEPVE